MLYNNISKQSCNPCFHFRNPQSEVTICITGQMWFNFFNLAGTQIVLFHVYDNSFIMKIDNSFDNDSPMAIFILENCFEEVLSVVFFLCGTAEALLIYYYYHTSHHHYALCILGSINFTEVTIFSCHITWSTLSAFINIMDIKWYTKEKTRWSGQQATTISMYIAKWSHKWGVFTSIRKNTVSHIERAITYN